MDTGPEFYKAILDHLCDGIYFVDRNRAITYWNRGAERISGYPAQAVLGRCCADNLLMHVDEQGDRLCNCSRCPLKQTMSDGVPREMQEQAGRARPRPRDERPVSARFHPRAARAFQESEGLS